MTHDPHHHQPTVSFSEQPDSWHLHSTDEGLPQEEHAPQANALALTVAFVASVSFVGAVILVSYLYFRVHTTTLRRERIETTAMAADFLDYRDSAKKKLHEYSWASPEAAAAGKVSLPIEIGIDRVLKAYASGPARTGGK